MRNEALAQELHHTHWLPAGIRSGQRRRIGPFRRDDKKNMTRIHDRHTPASII
jgi:hypothetical protein